MTRFCDRAERLIERAALAGYPEPEKLVALTPKEILWRFRAFSASRGVTVRRETSEAGMRRVLAGLGGPDV